MAPWATGATIGCLDGTPRVRLFMQHQSQVERSAEGSLTSQDKHNHAKARKNNRKKEPPWGIVLMTDYGVLGAPSQLLSGDDLKFKTRCYQTSGMASKTRSREIGFIILCSAGSYVPVARIPNLGDW